MVAARPSGPRKIGTHYATNCNGDVLYYSGRGYGYRQCKGCGATPDVTTREEVSRRRDALKDRAAGP